MNVWIFGKIQAFSNILKLSNFLDYIPVSLYFMDEPQVLKKYVSRSFIDVKSRHVPEI
jgi:hypothetical protein